MTFSGFTRSNMFDFRRDPRAPNAQASSGTAADESRPMTQPATGPSTTLTRPRAGGIIRPYMNDEGGPSKVPEGIAVGQAKDATAEKQPKPKVSSMRGCKEAEFVP
jgi:hypothetical protein